MDAQRFDEVVRSLTRARSRRGLLALLAALPLVGGLAALFGDEESAAKDRRRRRKQRHKRRTGKHKNRLKGQRKCQPKPLAKTCAGRCGAVRNNCGRVVDCGPCACAGPCPACQSCDAATGACAPDPGQQGQPCGEARCAAGTFTPRGACASGVCVPGTPVSCAPYLHCAGDACATTCQDEADCVADAHCDGEHHCVGNLPQGSPCANAGQCQSGHCVDGVCCASASCPQCQTCNVSGLEGSCSAVSNGTTCDDGNACTTDDVCTAGVCAGTPVVCNGCQIPDSCDPNTGSCLADAAKDHICDGPCSDSEWCDAGECAGIQETVTIPDCHSLCDGSTTVCGQTVTCPSCDLCLSQTGCGGINILPAGPVGAGRYCSISSLSFGTCTGNGDCDLGDYCSTSGTPDLCARICPF